MLSRQVLADYGKVVCRFNEAETADEMHYRWVFALVGSENMHYCHVVAQRLDGLASPFTTPHGCCNHYW